MPLKAGSPELPEGTRARVTEITVSSALDPDFEVAVQWRGGDTYAVTRYRRCLGADGEWDFELQPSSREDDWLAAHRFSLDRAVELAGQACAERAARPTSP